METKKLMFMGMGIILLLSIAVFAYNLPKNQNEVVCTMDYKPVCGIDGITYSNPCTAGEIEIDYEGECGSQNAAGGTFLAGSEIPELEDEELAAS